ncbi:MAG: DUF2508 domain-containing protein [Clostridiales bacterium]|nr:MAG: DUF2508 domain-containing protein [Clostridiales bacterium]RGB67015.1 DUF2508 family protein [Harryflintia acetispora]
MDNERTGCCLRFVSLNAKGEGTPKDAAGRLRVVRSPILEDIDEVLRQLRESSARFDLVCDDDLLESIIYEQNALMARYRYLIKLAKQDGLTVPRERLPDCVTL